ncbi:MAG TPA: hypothetical protein VH723_07745 [Candidatus Limnocylindrales bacterium]|jgi:hypothetical protein
MKAEPARLRRLPALRATVAAVVAACLVAGPAAPSTIARLTDSAASTGAFTADTLNPPTGLGVTGGTTANLTWTPTVDTYAGGYDVMRSTVSGSGYATIASPTPRTVSSYLDSPTVDGTYYYVLRSTASNWTSVQTGQVTAVVFMGVTGFKPCTAQAAETNGDANGYEVTPANGCADDGAIARDVDSGTNVNTTCGNAGKDRHRFTTFGIALPGTVTSINGISVRVKAAIDAVAGTNRICAELSWNNGVNYTAFQQVDITSTTLTNYTLGGTAFLWGRAWAVGNFTNANFRVRLTDVSSVATRDFSLDSVQVQVNYTP